MLPRDDRRDLLSAWLKRKCPGEQAIIKVMTHKVIYALLIPYGLVKEKENN